MAFTRSSHLSFGALIALGVFALAAGYYMPELRHDFIFAPEQADAEEAVAQIATREQLFYRKTSEFAVFTVAEAPAGSRVLGLNWGSLPTDDFRFDAALLPNNHLRLRALPRGETVRALKAPAQIYAAELSPRGKILRREWLP